MLKQKLEMESKVKDVVVPTTSKNPCCFVIMELKEIKSIFQKCKKGRTEQQRLK